tara:strand:- start:6368 stop:7153 length:786 start_codon:yes stop_codon:yes gene_type:complete
MKDKLTILTPTHSFKIETEGQFNGYLNTVPSAPSTALIEKEIESLHSKMKGTEECRHIISIDHKGTELDDAYANNLLQLTKKYKNLEILALRMGTTDPQYTATQNFLGLRDIVETDYFLQLEHDWLIDQEVDLNKIIKVMDENDFVKYIRFNQHQNTEGYPGSCDKNLEEEDRILEVPLLRTTEWSGNPHICRTDTWKHWWVNLVYPTPYCYVETSIKEAFQFSQEKMGWDLAKESWGVYIYGEKDAPPVIKHLDGNAFIR